MPRHVIVDGSNLATEGRSMPSLKQLNDAVTAFIDENPTDLITVVVDATFGHRIDPKEVPEFEEAIEHNELVAPPAGAIGRGDAFVLGIASKVGATILTNDSYQEFHADYAWLFDEGRLIGGKPVPNVGWVFVNRTPVRGPISRRATREKRSKTDAPPRRGASKAASQPMPVPKAPPPGSAAPRKPRHTRDDKAAPAAKETHPRATSGGHVNDLLAFLGFVERHPVGTSVNAIVESYSSHGAYVTIGDVRGYVPLRLMADPPPRSAREAVALGESVTLVVSSFAPARRSIDLAVPHLAVEGGPATDGAAAKAANGKTRAKGKSAPTAAVTKEPAATKATAKKTTAKQTTATKVTAKKAVTKKAVTKKAVTKKAVAPTKIAAKKAVTTPAKPLTKSAATKKVAGKKAAGTKVAGKKAAKKPAPTKATPTTSTTAKKAAATVAAKKATAPKKTVATKTAAGKKSASATKASATKAPAKKSAAKRA